MSNPNLYVYPRAIIRNGAIRFRSMKIPGQQYRRSEFTMAIMTPGGGGLLTELSSYGFRNGSLYNNSVFQLLSRCWNHNATSQYKYYRMDKYSVLTGFEPIGITHAFHSESQSRVPVRPAFLLTKRIVVASTVGGLVDFSNSVSFWVHTGLMTYAAAVATRNLEYFIRPFVPGGLNVYALARNSFLATGLGMQDNPFPDPERQVQFGICGPVGQGTSELCHELILASTQIFIQKVKFGSKMPAPPAQPNSNLITRPSGGRVYPHWIRY